MSNEINTVGAINAKFPGGWWVQLPSSQCLTYNEIVGSGYFKVNSSYGNTECPRMDDIVRYYNPVASYRTYDTNNSSSDRSILRDLTGHGYDMTLYGFSYTSSSGYNNGGLVFDGIDDYAVCNNFPALNNGFTIVAIRKLTGIDSQGSTFTKRHVSSRDIGAFQIEHYNTPAYNRLVRSYSKDNVVSFSTSSDIALVVTPTLYNNQTIETISNTDSTFLAINAGYKDANGNLRQFGKKQIFYALEVYDRVLPSSEINDIKTRLLNEYNARVR